jgi:hypothetical protein
LARENPRWGYLRIVGECRKLGVALSGTSVCNVLRRYRGIDLEVPVAYTSFGEFTKVDRVQRADRIGGLVHEYRVAA